MKKVRGVFIKNEAEIAKMRTANRIVAAILDAIGRMVAPGVRTVEFEELANRLCLEYEVAPAFKGYLGYPYALCISINEQVVHGFPSERKLVEGDIVSIDMGVIYQGFFGDAARTFPVGRISPTARKLLDVTEAALMAGVAAAQVGQTVADVSGAVYSVVREAGFDVVRRFVGHGIGRKLHEKPEVPNYVTPAGAGVTLKSGMVIAIEPMVTVGKGDVEILADRWTAVTKDRSLSGHFEHSVAVTGKGPEILSVSEDDAVRRAA